MTLALREGSIVEVADSRYPLWKKEGKVESIWDTSEHKLAHVWFGEHNRGLRVGMNYPVSVLRVKVR